MISENTQISIVERQIILLTVKTQSTKPLLHIRYIARPYIFDTVSYILELFYIQRTVVLMITGRPEIFLKDA